MYPDDYRYSKEHEWIQVKGNEGTIGITDHAQKQLGDIVDIVLPDVGKKLKQDGNLGEIDSVKASSEIYSPVSGVVTAVNSAVLDAPEKINEDPHGAAWLIKIQLDDPGQLAGLMTASAYQSFVQGN